MMLQSAMGIGAQMDEPFIYRPQKFGVAMGRAILLGIGGEYEHQITN